jgi:chlorite dismutase
MIETMNDWPYHQYLFFELDRAFYRLPSTRQTELKRDLGKLLQPEPPVELVTYATQGFKPGTTFMVWIRAHKPERLQDFVHALLRTEVGEYLTLRQSLFGLIRQSQYSNRPQKSDQVIQADERLPYLVIYPFTKTPEWHLLPFDQRKEHMLAHIMIGIKHPAIRQCLLYAYGVDDHEFIVSYETPSFEAFQDLVMQLRGTEVRRYTQNDLPIYTCIYKPVEELMAWL